MNMHRIIRRLHRWVSIVFTLTVIGIFVSQALGHTEGWLFYTPLAPLMLMMISGLYLFALPYVTKGPDKATAGRDRE